ncbi:cysteine proteinase [Artomyces pyxidatus]|uniref:Cysteine proteinase n=1 Tax=Artomyces pyxidatus TaxID=48021 RepID=A0ACB8T6V5_9AGAM|nr:cysteine proteinase [Artomyces pyxidatus]
MSVKRKRRALHEGLPPGERLKRSKLATEDDWDTPWGWVGTDVTDASNISRDHLLSTCGFSSRSSHPFCSNKFRKRAPEHSDAAGPRTAVEGELQDDVIVISEDETPSCSKRACAKNPNCLNYLGQEKWEDEEGARKAYMTAANIGRDPRLQNRKEGLPVGLKNLGATCYANAYIQVWFQDVPFRNGVYQCQPSQDGEHSFEDSPIYQLQATFAALQESKRKVFNPIKLVESLKLRTNEQQDAQEFSKLFMSHLDTEFQKQTDPVLKHLLSDQFQGKQAYTTTCLKCGNCSENESDFLEIEVNLENNASLESRIRAVVAPETLSGDNKYRCPRCDSLEDATRQLVLRTLPPVLHFSLLRFVFDVSSMERKKSKHNITFPLVLDMNQFLDTGRAEVNGGNIYELQGILLHKGSSAYHGHYEATVFDMAHDSWFTFNDEVVTKVKPPGTGAPDDEKSKVTKPRPTAKKRRRVEDSDDDVEIIEQDPPLHPNSKTMSSKDAYMLVYTRRGSLPQASEEHLSKPPARALDAIRKLNVAHEEACNAHCKRLRAANEEFEDLRLKMMDIYRCWEVSSHDEDSLVVSQEALKTFLSKPFVKAAGELSKSASPEQSDNTHDDKQATSSNGASGTPESSLSSQNSQRREGDISVEEIVCQHGRLDPSKAADFKRIRYTEYENIVSYLGCRFLPELCPEDVCKACVTETFTEKLYHHQHPLQVAQFDAVADNREFGSFWISKLWLKDWRQSKPKMHVPFQKDPSPDSSSYRGHVECEHGGLSLNTTGRQRISREAYGILKTLFPSWNTLADDVEPCAVCEIVIQSSREDTREQRRHAEDEKAKLRHMHENALTGNVALLEDVPCALIPSSFVKTWKFWILRPGRHPRPDQVDTASLVCEHGLLPLDPNAGDLDKSVCLVRMQDWQVLQSLYDVGPLIAIENRSVLEDGILRSRFVYKPELCGVCRIKRKSNYEVTHVTIRILGDDDADPTPQTFTKERTAPVPTIDGRQTSIVTYGTRKTAPQRQSKRIRSVAKRKEMKLAISKEMSVKDIKLMLQDELDIPTICQRLFYQGSELQDNRATVASLDILVDDVLDFREAKENADLLDESDADAAPRRREADGGGFGGTLLGGELTSDSMLDDTTLSERTSSPPADAARACPACTYQNAASASACEICDTFL